MAHPRPRTELVRKPSRIQGRVLEAKVDLDLEHKIRKVRETHRNVAKNSKCRQRQPAGTHASHPAQIPHAVRPDWRAVHQSTKKREKREQKQTRQRDPPGCFTLAHPPTPSAPPIGFSLTKYACSPTCTASGASICISAPIRTWAAVCICSPRTPRAPRCACALPRLDII